MSKNIKLAVAGAVLALSASAANAGIIIPAGEWTLDINGNVNSFMSQTHVKHGAAITGSVHAVADEGTKRGTGTGLLPAWIGFTGKTRQNDLDVEFTISLQPGASNNTAHGDGSIGGENASFLNRQTYVTFGDKSWGSIKLGKDLGIYASDAILNDMTLLGVGIPHSAGGGGLSGSTINTTTGGIGGGYQYAAWRAGASYTTPNWNGFQATVGLMNPNQVCNTGVCGMVEQDRFGFEGKASYAWTGDVSGKVWTSGASYDVKQDVANSGYRGSKSVSAYDIGVNLNYDKFGLTVYGYDGRGNGSAAIGVASIADSGKRRDGNGGYVQATYVIPTKTKLGIAYGETRLDKASGEVGTGLMDTTERTTVGAYHPLTKHLNLVAEYTRAKIDTHAGGSKFESDNVSLGGILFF
jgi:predicted porin